MLPTMPVDIIKDYQRQIFLKQNEALQKLFSFCSDSVIETAWFHTETIILLRFQLLGCTYERVVPGVFYPEHRNYHLKSGEEIYLSFTIMQIWRLQRISA